MSEISQLEASLRTHVGTGAARAARRKGLVPCIIYGQKLEPEAITLDFNIMQQRIKTGRFYTTLFDINIDGQIIRVLPRDIQFDRIRDFPIHIDFMRLTESSKISVEIPVKFVNEEESLGLKRGGALNIVRHEIQLMCPATAIPDEINIDISGLDIGDSLHVSAVTLPDGVTTTITDRDFTIVTITSPSGVTSTDGEDDDNTEGDERADDETESEE